MSLATRCAQCGTVFRVVEDQLKVSEGWVRCGRCEAVFNALESLFDLEQEAPPPWPGGAEAEGPQGPAGASISPPHKPAAPPMAARSSHPLGPLEPPPFEPSDLPDEDQPASARLDHRPLLHEPDDAAYAAGFGSTYRDARPPADAPAAREPERPRFEPTQAPLDDDLDDDEPRLYGRSSPLPMRESPPDLSAPARPAAAPAAAAMAAPAAVPEFMRRTPPVAGKAARRAAPATAWQRPGVRTALAVVCVLLALLLLAQVALRWRDVLAARWPESAPVLRGLCAVAGCEVEPMRRVDSLAVDSSGLVKLEGSSDQYEFTATLRNNDRVPVMLPSLELTLTDAQGQVVSRKVLSAAGLGARGSTIAPGATLPLQGVLAGGDRKITGYSAEIFYP